MSIALAPSRDPNFKPVRVRRLILVGDCGTGKTTWVRVLAGGSFNAKYLPTFGVQIHRVNMEAKEKWGFNIWDTPGLEMFGGSDYYAKGECALIFHDLSREATYDAIPKWIDRVARARPGIPIVIVGTKRDVPGAGVRTFPGFANCILSNATVAWDELMAPLVAVMC